MVTRVISPYFCNVTGAPPPPQKKEANSIGSPQIEVLLTHAGAM